MIKEKNKNFLEMRRRGNRLVDITKVNKNVIRKKEVKKFISSFRRKKIKELKHLVKLALKRSKSKVYVRRKKRRPFLFRNKMQKFMVDTLAKEAFRRKIQSDFKDRIDRSIKNLNMVWNTLKKSKDVYKKKKYKKQESNIKFQRSIQNFKLKKKKRYCILCYKYFNSNFFITISNLKGRLFSYCSTGLLSYSRMKKRKVSALMVNPMMHRLLPVLKKNKITHIRFYIKSNITLHVFNIIKFLKKGGFLFDYIKFVKSIPHHYGQRKRKLRRL